MRTASVAAERWRRLVRLQRGSGLSIAAFCRREGERAQRLGAPGPLAGGVGEGGDPGVRAAYPLEGYRRLAFMMLDADVVAVSPSSGYRVLKQAGRSVGGTVAQARCVHLAHRA